MFANSKIIRLALGACLVAAWLPIGNGLLQPAQASAAEIIRVGPIVRSGPIVRVDPVVRVGPVVPVAPIVRVEPVVPVYPEPLLPRYDLRRWDGFRWYR
jgi:hypothetical protein